MSRPRIILFICAIISVLSGLLLIVGWTLNIHRGSLPGAVLAMIGYVLAMLAFIAIAYQHNNQLRFFGILGFVLIVIAHALFIPWVFLDIARLSGIVQGVDWYFVERNGPTGIIAIIGGFAFISGYLLFGIDLARIKTMSQWPAYLLLLAAIQPFIFPIIEVGKLLPRIAGLALILFGIQFMRLFRKQRAK
ncbi:MAG: hypothetical protein HC831_03545 [Chloroflexia bacterium]|nr:hypothetical protein [Chloroflexia bacterium]